MAAKLNGIEMDWRERGEGDAILFIHGFPFNSVMWEPQLARLPGGWRGIAPDLRGFGATAAGSEALYSMALYARDLEALLDHLSVQQCVICGLSMGGYIAFQFWRLFRERVRAAVLCDTRAAPDSPEARTGRYQLAERARADGVGAVIDAMLPKLVAANTRRTRPDVVEQITAMMCETPIETVARTLAGLAERPDAAAILPTIDVPALIVMGDEDAITGRGPVEMLARGIRGARMVTIDAAGHLPNLEQPDAFNEALSSFLAELPRPVPRQGHRSRGGQ